MDDKKHIVAITALIKNKKGNKFLMLKRNKNEVAYPGKWALPGGKVEKGEMIMDVLKREILEETGLEIEEPKQFLGDYTFVRPDGHNVIGFTFAVKAKSNNVEISQDFEDYRWVGPKELKNIDYIKGTEKEVEVAFA
ncbi:MAG: NUDIX domain-containing protein [Candidatus Berkelbacteria bacterium]|nr:NUDIX domain-containing protein [Candidatus Berkelbacteria bacterium]